MTTLFNVISQDGYIARPDGSEDFIPDSLWPQTLKFFSRYDTLVMGRKTYEALQRYDTELLAPYEQLANKKVVVTRNLTFLPKHGYVAAYSIDEAVALGSNVLVTSGPNLNVEALEKGLVDKIVLWRVAAMIGEGIEPFPKEFYEMMADKIEIDEKG